ncbi:MAG: pyridoxamine 5'-phosphate oxidase family protein [Patescibacteria group bacterium]|jgi:uncharacterized protein YhbP (UPF0306 family)
MPLSLSFQHQTLSDEVLNVSIQSILESSKLLSMSTVNSNNTAHINTAYFAFDENFNFFIVTKPSTKHAKNLANNPSVAINVFDGNQKFWTSLKGLQLFGTCAKTLLTEVPHALTTYNKRFPIFSEFASHPDDFTKKAISSRFYTININSIKLFDEPTFGEEVYIDLNLQKQSPSTSL